jgi:hypothetical protein
LEKRIHGCTDKKDLIENGATGTASILRVLKVNKLDDTQNPLQGTSTFGKVDPGLSEALGNHEPTLEDQDAKPVEGSDQEGVIGMSFNCQQPMQSMMNHGWPS